MRWTNRSFLAIAISSLLFGGIAVPYIYLALVWRTDPLRIVTWLAPCTIFLGLIPGFEIVDRRKTRPSMGLLFSISHRHLDDRGAHLFLLLHMGAKFDHDFLAATGGLVLSDRQFRDRDPHRLRHHHRRAPFAIGKNHRGKGERLRHIPPPLPQNAYNAAS